MFSMFWQVLAGFEGFLRFLMFSDVLGFFDVLGRFGRFWKVFQGRILENRSFS